MHLHLLAGLFWVHSSSSEDDRGGGKQGGDGDGGGGGGGWGSFGGDGGRGPSGPACPSMTWDVNEGQAQAGTVQSSCSVTANVICRAVWPGIKDDSGEQLDTGDTVLRFVQGRERPLKGMPLLCKRWLGAPASWAPCHGPWPSARRGVQVVTLVVTSCQGACLHERCPLQAFAFAASCQGRTGCQSLSWAAGRPTLAPRAASAAYRPSWRRRPAQW